LEEEMAQQPNQPPYQQYQQPWPNQPPYQQYQQPWPGQQPYQQRKLGGCLMAWVVVVIIVGTIEMLLALTGLGASIYDPISYYPAIAVVADAATITGYIGILNFKKWGCYLVLAMYAILTLIRIVIIAMVPAFAAQGIVGVFVGLIGMAIFYALIHNIIRYLD
jgi:hypothetical protein